MFKVFSAFLPLLTQGPLKARSERNRAKRDRKRLARLMWKTLRIRADLDCIEIVNGQAWLNYGGVEFTFIPPSEFVPATESLIAGIVCPECNLLYVERLEYGDESLNAMMCKMLPCGHMTGGKALSIRVSNLFAELANAYIQSL